MPSLIGVVKCAHLHNRSMGCDLGRSYPYHSGLDQPWFPWVAKRQLDRSRAQSDSDSIQQNTPSNTSNYNPNQPLLSAPQTNSDQTTPTATSSGSTSSPSGLSSSNRLLAIVLPTVIAIMAVGGAILYFCEKYKRRQTKTNNKIKNTNTNKRKFQQNSDHEQDIDNSTHLTNPEKEKHRLTHQIGNGQLIAPTLSSANPSSLAKDVDMTPVNCENGPMNSVQVVETNKTADHETSIQGTPSPPSTRSDCVTELKSANESSVFPINSVTTSSPPPTLQDSTRSPMIATDVSTTSVIAPESLEPAEHAPKLDSTTTSPLPKSSSFWKRMSQVGSSLTKKPRREDLEKPSPTIQVDAELDEANNATTASTTEPDQEITSVSGTDRSNEVSENRPSGVTTVGGLAGIGVRDRNSIALFAMENSNSESPKKKKSKTTFE